MNYCDAQDVIDRFDFVLYRKVRNANVEYICLHDETKRKHHIDGWKCITALTLTGDVLPLLDIWTGFSGKNDATIKQAVKGACERYCLTFAG